MKKSGFISSLVLFMLIFSSFSVICQENKNIFGYWLNESEDAVISIYKKETVIFGELVWLASPLNTDKQPRRDIMNDEPELRSRLLVGIPVLKDFEYDDGIWKHGRIYNYKNGNSYNAKIRLEDPSELKLTGFYGFFFFLAKTKTWSRVTDKEKYGLK